VTAAGVIQGGAMKTFWILLTDILTMAFIVGLAAVSLIMLAGGIDTVMMGRGF
jgi:hypothetical protein